MNYHIEKLNEQTWLIEEYSNTASAYMYLLTGKEKALLIDTGFGTIPLKSICEELTGLPVTVALTHGHVDHIGGTGAFEEVWLAKEDKELYEAHSREDVRHIFTQDELLPVKENCSYFENEMVFEIGDRPVRVVRTPLASIRFPCLKYRATNSAFFSHATQSIKSVWSLTPGRSTATVNSTTGFPLGVVRSSGSRVKRPLMAIMFIG